MLTCCRRSFEKTVFMSFLPLGENTFRIEGNILPIEILNTKRTYNHCEASTLTPS